MISQFIEDLTINIVWLLPKYFLKWCYIRVAAHSTMVYGKLTPCEINILMVLEAWDKDA